MTGGAMGGDFGAASMPDHSQARCIKFLIDNNLEAEILWLPMDRLPFSAVNQRKSCKNQLSWSSKGVIAQFNVRM
jgi:hypothetical protein